MPVGLPGKYTCRGDWFLAVARGSRSYRLGERAIDLLCTRRANIVRVQTGVGLPVRDNKYPNAIELWTSLWHPGTPAERIRYSELIKLGGSSATTKHDNNDGGSLTWIW